MPAYVVVTIEVHDPDLYAQYAAGTPDAIAAHGGRYLIRGGAVARAEGDWDPHRLVVLEFADMAGAHRWYDSPEYQALVPLRKRAATSTLLFVEGYEP